eukprot:s899_g18.t1
MANWSCDARAIHRSIMLCPNSHSIHSSQATLSFDAQNGTNDCPVVLKGFSPSKKKNSQLKHMHPQWLKPPQCETPQVTSRKWRMRVTPRFADQTAKVHISHSEEV